jgi:hypothetical protein
MLPFAALSLAFGAYFLVNRQVNESMQTSLTTITSWNGGLWRLPWILVYALTGNAEFNDYVVKGYGSTHPFQADDWSVYGPTKGDALLVYASLAIADPEAKRAIQARKTGLMTSSNLYGFRPELDLYRAYMRPTMYHWGSNNQRGAVGNTNYAALRWGFAKGEAAVSYRERAAGMLHSFHGVNPMQLVYLTNMYADGGDVPTPNATDVLYLATYPLFLAGLVLMIRARVVDVPWHRWLDGFVLVLIVATPGTLIVETRNLGDGGKHCAACRVVSV